MITRPKQTDKLLTSAEMIAQAGLDWKVRQAPVLFEGNGLSKFDGQVVNFRDDTGMALGIVSNSYRVVQNSTAFAFLDSLLGESVEMYSGAGSYNLGAQVFIRAKLPGTLTFAGNEDDRGEKYVDFYTSHDGSIALEARLMAFRLVCSNGLKMFKKIGSGRAKHTMNLSLDSIRRSLGLMNEQFSIMETLSNKMGSNPVSRDRMPLILEKVGLIPTESDRSTRARNIIDDVSRLFDGYGKGARMTGARGTAWGAYNAITEYIDHHRGSDAEKREVSANIGGGSRIKEMALEVLSA